jgi:hypothetical protein
MLERYCLKAGVPQIDLDRAKATMTEYNRRKSAIKAKLVGHGGTWCEKFPAERSWLFASDAQAGVPQES